MPHNGTIPPRQFDDCRVTGAVRRRTGVVVPHTHTHTHTHGAS